MEVQALISVTATTKDVTPYAPPFGAHSSYPPPHLPGGRPSRKVAVNQRSVAGDPRRASGIAEEANATLSEANATTPRRVR